jgi:hypothetical protein
MVGSVNKSLRLPSPFAHLGQLGQNEIVDGAGRTSLVFIGSSHACSRKSPMSSSRFQQFVRLALLMLGPVIVAGCGPRVSRDELGTGIFDAKDLPGADKPYDRPEMHVPGSKPAAEDAPAEADRSETPSPEAVPADGVQPTPG